MNVLLKPTIRRSIVRRQSLRRIRRPLSLFASLIVFPALAFAQSGGTPFDTGFTAIQTLFTGTIAKVASLVAIVIGGYGFAHGEPGAKKPRSPRVENRLNAAHAVESVSEKPECTADGQ
jgi:type IV secretory pathway VirB2 component (pilin)